MIKESRSVASAKWSGAGCRGHENPHAGPLRITTKIQLGDRTLRWSVATIPASCNGSVARETVVRTIADGGRWDEGLPTG